MILSKAEQACIQIYNDFDRDEAARETTSVRDAWLLGKRLALQNSISDLSIIEMARKEGFLDKEDPQERKFVNFARAVLNMVDL